MILSRPGPDAAEGEKQAMKSMARESAHFDAGAGRLSGVERLASLIFDRLETGCLRLRFPSGAVREFRAANPSAQSELDGDLIINDWSMIWRLFHRGAVGLGEGYMAGEWDSPDLARLLWLFAANKEIIESRLRPGLGFRLFSRLEFARNRNNRKGSRRNIAHHYDLGNDFYELWLDDTMTYSAALFEHDGEDLDVAQKRKYRALARATGISEGDHVLEIGCGWGGFAEYVIREYDCRVTGITISNEQLAYAKRRLFEAGLSERADFRLIDYRDIEGSYDRIISIEMLEAVGESYWGRYFQKLRSLLKAGGKAGIQAITIENHRFDSERNKVGFIPKYIFPGGILPCDSVLKRHLARAGLRLHSRDSFGPSYARTLSRWSDNFRSSLSAIEKLGFDARFVRMWLFYLAYCEAGFRHGIIDVSQYVAA